MPKITIDIDEKVKKILSKRAKRNLLNLREQIEEILRSSAVRTKNKPGYLQIKIDDKLVAMFSREKRGRKKKVKKKN